MPKGNHTLYVGVLRLGRQTLHALPYDREQEEERVVQQGVIASLRLLPSPCEMPVDRGDCVFDVSQALLLVPAHNGAASFWTSARMRSLSMSGVATSTRMPRIPSASRRKAARSRSVLPAQGRRGGRCRCRAPLRHGRATQTLEHCAPRVRARRRAGAAGAAAPVRGGQAGRGPMCSEVTALSPERREPASVARMPTGAARASEAWEGPPRLVAGERGLRGARALGELCLRERCAGARDGSWRRAERLRVSQGEPEVKAMGGRARALPGRECAHRPAAQTLNQAVGHGVVPR